MSVEVTCTYEPHAQLAVSEAELARIFESVLKAEGVTRACEVSVSVVLREGIRALNAAWRGIDAETDVISLECERPDDEDLAEGEVCELGDIALAPDVLAQQAAEFGLSAADETRLMAIHSLLHLLGYDHLEEAEAQRMEAREDALLAQVCGRELPHVEVTRHADEKREVSP